MFTLYYSMLIETVNFKFKFVDYVDILMILFLQCFAEYNFLPFFDYFKILKKTLIEIIEG